MDLTNDNFVVDLFRFRKMEPLSEKVFRVKIPQCILFPDQVSLVLLTMVFVFVVIVESRRENHGTSFCQQSELG